MKEWLNPFEYEAANNLSDDRILDYYIEDFNYSRFIQSKRNVFLIGERGSGKTMTLLYNRYRIQAKRNSSLDLVGVYIPCNTPLTHKKEYLLLEKFQASVISEHFLSLAIIYEIATTLSEIPDVLRGADEVSLRSEMEFVLGFTLRPDCPFFESVRQCVQREIVETQKRINATGAAHFYENSLSFSSVVVPLFSCLQKVPALKNSHFMLMIDDAHDLNEYQIRALNSWIAYRDHSAFSFKVATAKVQQPDYKTASGGSILEGHDFILIDMEQVYQNEHSNFGRMADSIIGRRLERVGINLTPDEFFPIHEQLREDLAMCEEVVRKRATDKYPGGTNRQIGDYVYKYTRAEYFRQRSSKANRPPYSGFEILVYLSTGVIRNLLEPCYWMYDKVRSLAKQDVSPAPLVQAIPSDVQNEIILDRSQRLWDRLKEGLDRVVEGCSSTQAKQAFNLLDNLAILFRERLLHHETEPRANSFTISGMNEEYEAFLIPLLDILRKAQYLYTRSGAAKDRGRRETYYVPNRMLWPARGLDPHGQHARVSLKATDLWMAAQGKPIPYNSDPSPSERSIFDEPH